MGVGFKVGGSGGFKSFVVVTANVGETITLVKSDDATLNQTITATMGTATFTVKKKGRYNLTSSDGATATVDVVKTNTAYEVVVKWESIIRATANSNILVTAKLGTYTESGTAGSATPTDTVDITVRKKGTYTVTSADGASTSVAVTANGTTYTADVIVLSYIAVTGNAGFTVTASIDSYSVSGTLDSNGKATLSVRKLGTYAITSSDGSSSSVNVTADGGTYSVTSKWSSTVTVNANPSAVITLTNQSNSNIKYSATAHSSTGVATITVLCRGTYDISSNNNASYQAEGNNSSVTVTGATASARYVKLNIPASLAIGNYSSNVLTAYWTKPSVWTGCMVRYKSGTSAPSNRSDGTQLAKGAGNSIALTTSSTVNGYNTGALTANTNYAFAIWSYITINGVEYWCATTRTATGKATNYVGSSQTITSTKTWSVPTGWRQIKVCVVGGGGAGGQGGAGGGGGYVTNTSAFSVTPGQSFAVTIGGGGAINTADNSRGGSGGQSKFGSYTANGGTGGIGNTGTINYSTEYGGGSGGCGGGGMYEGSSSYDRTNSRSGGYGGTNGGDGQTTTTYDKTTAVRARRYGGKGQGTTTKAFGNGTAYGGGGGGGTAYFAKNGAFGGAGGDYGGGAGGGAGYESGSRIAAKAGTANSGGGGGGGYGGAADAPTLSGGAGGSGVVLVQCVA